MAQSRLNVIASHIDCAASDAVLVKKLGDIAVVSLNSPPMNALGAAVRIGLSQQIEALQNDSDVKAIVITGNGKVFSAGADITEFGKTMKQPYLPELIDQVEASKKVVVAAIHGVALGGGTELALGCHYRVLQAKARMGLPEIMLGLIPGAGGTQRLPRLVGPKNAIQICCAGVSVRAKVATGMGLVDRVATGDVVDAAVALAKELVAKGAKPRRLSEDTSKLGYGLMNRFIFNAARGQIAKNSRGMISPLKALDAVQAATQVSSFKEGMAAERRIFMECAASPQAQGMQHFFFSERRALKIPGLPANLPVKPVRRAGVIGGGTMGGGIAMCFMNVGIPVVLIETSPDRKKFCLDNISRNYGVRVAKGKMTEDGLKQRMSLLNVVVDDYQQLQDVDIVIEAVFESMRLKKEIFAKLDRVCKADCILASNTSTLSIDEIASATSRPQKVIGAHFFSPANVMKLLEFVRGDKTDAETIVRSMAVGKRIKKAPVLVGNCFGFISNRLIGKGGFQAMCMVEEGAFPHEVDAVIKKFGFPMGLFAMQDLAGLDVGARIRSETPKHLLPKRDVVALPEALVKLGRHGQKTGKGFYKYGEDKRTPSIDNEVNKIVLKVSKDKGIKRRTIPEDEIRDRYIFQLINEAAYCLKEGFAIRPSDIDIVFIYGFGFPPYRGGPCHYADTVGIAKVVEGIRTFHRALGPDTYPEPCPLLVEMAASGKTFADMNKV